VVLNLMQKEGYITQAQAESAARDELQFGSVRFPIDAPHFVMAVWKQLEREYPEQVYGGGLDVITTVDLNWQQAAQRITQRQLAALNSPENGVPANAQNAAVIALDPYTGQILTMLGSPDYFNEAIDGAVNATLASRQPGSALKPFTYAAAMNPNRDNPMTAATVLLDVETPFVTRRLESYTPSNFGQVENGPVTVRESLGSSYNIPAVLALEDVGLEAFRQLMGDAGLTDLVDNSQVDLSITLGGGEVRLLDLAAAYSIFPNGGYRIDPSMILKVTSRDGDVLYEWDAPELNRRVLDDRVAYLITDILSDNNARIPSFGEHSALQIGRPSAAKTGTTTDFRDNWVMGYTPNLVVGVWVGNADNTPMVEVTGVSGAGPIYNQFMREVLLGQPELDFARPDGLTRLEVCALSGKLPTPQCALRNLEWFIPGTQPTDYDDWYQEFTIDRRTGLLADDTTPNEDRVTRTYLILPQEARDWGVRNGIDAPPDESMVAVPRGDDDLRLLEPDPYTVFEFSPITPRETQRLRFTVGVPPETDSVTYYLNGQAIGTVTSSPWDVWWPLEIGTHELTAVATLADGSTDTSEPIPFTVVEYSPPQPRTVLPGEN
jgi:membrane peptidoglycan carboxypeptidase